MSRTAAGRRAGVRLTVEQLESRDVPSTLAVQEFKLPAHTNFPDSLTLGGDGNVWFTCDLASLVGYITPAGSVALFDTSSVSSHGLNGLTRGRDGNIWFSEFYGKIGKITHTGQITQFRLKNHGEPESIAAGPDGNLWITTFDNYVGRITRSDHVTWFRHHGEPAGKIISFHGALYFQEYDMIGRVTPHGVFTGKFHMPHHGHVADLTAGPDGKVWFTEDSPAGDFVGSLTPGGRIREYYVPSTNGGAGHLTAGADGNLYVRDGDALLAIHTNGTIFASRDLGFIAGNGSVVQGGDGNVWYADYVLDRIGVAHVTG